jgi:zinc-finger-containing domain
MFCRQPARPGSGLAKARMAAHSSFDYLWKSGGMTRSEAYTWLAEQLGIEGKDCHMVMFSKETCRRVVALCDQWSFAHV